MSYTVSSSASLSSFTVVHCSLELNCLSIQAHAQSKSLRSGLLAGLHSKSLPGTRARTVLRLPVVVCWDYCNV